MRRLLIAAAITFAAGCGDATGPADSQAPSVPDLPYARGIHLTHLDANQGVGVVVLDGSRLVPPAERNARLLQNRPTLMWGVWEVDRGWKSRPVRAELHLALPDGRAETLVHELVIGPAPSTFADTSRSIHWEIPAELAVPGVTFQVYLLEVGSEPTGRLPDPLPIHPIEPEPVGFEESLQILRVTVVPVQHEYPGSCTEVPELTSSDLETLGELLYRRNPTERVVMTLRKPIVWTESLETYDGLLAALSQLRFQDRADPAQYYAGFVHHCVRTGGQAIDLPDFPTRENAWTRTVVAAWRGTASLTASTLVHEMGHAQGRRHVRCTGAEGSPDPDYPYPRGNIGVWGYNVVVPDAHMPWLSGRTYDPDTTWDYMSYCTGAQHVSDYGWEEVYPFIQEISSWEAESPAPSPPSPAAGVPGDSGGLLVGLLHTEDPGAAEFDGGQEWFTVSGSRQDRPSSPGYSLELVTDERVFRLSASVRRQDETGVINVVAELPVPFEGVTRITLQGPRGTLRIPKERVRRPEGGRGPPA